LTFSEEKKFKGLQCRVLKKAMERFQFEALSAGKKDSDPGIKAALSCFEEGLRFVVQSYRDRSLQEPVFPPLPPPPILSLQ